MSGWNICYILEKNEVKTPGSCFSLKLHFLAGVTCLAPKYNVTLPPWFNFNVNFTCGEGLYGASATSVGPTRRSPDQEPLRPLFPLEFLAKSVNEHDVTYAFVWDDLGHRLHSSLHLVSVNKIC